MTARASTIGLLMRHVVTVLVSVVALCDPSSQSPPLGRAIFALVAVWSAVRVMTRSKSWPLLSLDYAAVILVCLTIPVLTPDPLFYTFNSAPQAIAGTAVISFTVSAPARYSLPLACGVAAAYAYGAAGLLGWAGIGAVGALYYFVLQWITSALVRMTLVRVAEAVDQARHARETAELDETVASAVRNYELDQLSALHDTAAATLLVAGYNTEVAGGRVAAQARRDLLALSTAASERQLSIELVAALRDCAAYVRTPVTITGLPQLWIDGHQGQAVVSAAREAMNNVDKHALATELLVAVDANRVTLTDNGIGFVPGSPRSGHGIEYSLVARLRRIGGDALVQSAPGAGTVVELRWPEAQPRDPQRPAVEDPDRLIARMRMRYGVALAGYALANLAFGVPHGALAFGVARVDVVLAVLCAASTVALIPAIWGRRWIGTWPAAATLLAIGGVQTLLLPVELVGGAAHWAQGAIGWCLIPLLLGLPIRLGVPILVCSWLILITAQVVHHPVADTFANVAYGTASIFGVQLFALIFSAMMRDAAITAHTESQRRQQLVADELVAAAVHSQHQKRLANVISEVVPILDRLSCAETIDTTLRQQARTHSRKMRMLFDRADAFDHPLLQQLRPAVDAAEDRHVAITLETDKDLPILPTAEIAAVVAVFTQVLAVTQESARLVLGSGGGVFSASIVATGVDPITFDLSSVGGTSAEMVVTNADDAVWVEVRLLMV